MVTPMMRSRSAPKRSRSAPLSLVERTPPMVERSGHKPSKARRWPCCASVCCKDCSVQPASKVTVRSAQACSTIRFSLPVERRRSACFGGLPQPSFVPPPRGVTEIPASLASARVAAKCFSSAGSATNRGTTPATASVDEAARRFSGPTAAWRFSSNLLVFGMAVAEAHHFLSVALGDSRGFKGMRDVFARLFAAEARSRKNFRWIRKLQRVEGAAHPLHRVEVRLGEHLRHHALLFFPDAVFAGDRAARFEAQLQNAVGKRLGCLLLPGDAAVVENQWMQVSVAGVENVGDANPRLFTEACDLAHHARQSGARDYAVLHDVVR